MVAQLDGRNYALYGKVWEDVDPEISHWVSPLSTDHLGNVFPLFPGKGKLFCTNQ